ncbi:hypothetical protein [Nitrosospira sp. Nsp13]|uniref:hypothetical protein n=1 Tax=Nitrosospira sp. Nsp13 TaxID=1855332 RepID=UPI00087F5AC6|nr:hypothetical protein [Nitrosospira sp. Nsp13]SCY29165.1 hypothetical protein SAMN05216308_10711 [Nitrosospira sp. Nsp13]
MKKKKSKPHKKRSASKRGPFISGHPLNGVPLEIRQHIAVEHGRREHERFETLLPQITELVARIDPLHTLSLMATYGLMGASNEQGNLKSSSWNPKVQQGHIEFLQALCLRKKLELSKEFPEPSSIQLLFDWLPDLFSAYHQMRLGSPVAAETENSSKYGAGFIPVQEFMRAHTAVVRNWGYFGNVTRISRELLSRVDDDYERLAGMKLSKIVDIFEGLVRRHERKINEHQKKVHSALSLRTKEAMLEKFFATFELRGAVDDFRTRLASPRITYEQAKWELLPWSDRFIGPALIITNQEIAEEFGLDLKAVDILTNRISLAFSDLAEEDPENFFLDNPVWLRPLIYMQKDCYLCALPQTLLSFMLPIADELLIPFDGLQTKLSNVRAIFLEDEVGRLFETAFPSCIKHRGFKWKEGSQQFESDLVIRFDTTVILVEAKSGRVSWPALRGAPSRLIEHIRKLIVEPSDQSGRLAQRLEKDIARLKNNETPTLGFPLPMDGVTCVVRLSVMLHDFATIQSVPSMLADTGVLKNVYPLAPCMSLADLDVMLDLLETPYLRLHYLRRRAELLMSLRTIGDELDMLGMYLDTAMNLGTIQNKDKTIIISGYSAKIDRFYSLRDESRPSKKPKPNISQWFKSLCEQLEERARPGWSEIACALLSIAPIDQTKVERYVRSFAQRVKAGKPLKYDQDTMVLIPPEWSDQALAFQVKSKYDLDPYSSHSQNIAQQAFESEHVKRCFVLVVDSSDNHLNYLSAAMYIEGDTSRAVFY